MQRIMLKSKIHRATLTGSNLNYEGSITIDADLMEKADLLPGEQVHVLDINNGARFITYVIGGDRGSGDILLNGAAARLGQIGDKVIILSYGQLPTQEAEKFEAAVVFVDENNKSRK
jgi:aspartate 1-decarboxylase